jgi:hypothetical protein
MAAQYVKRKGNLKNMIKFDKGSLLFQYVYSFAQ